MHTNGLLGAQEMAASSQQANAMAVDKRDGSASPAQAGVAAAGPSGSGNHGVPPPQATSPVHSTRVHIGMKLNKWVVINRIGAGSFGETFSAIDIADMPANLPLLEAEASQEEIDVWCSRLPPPEERKEVCVKVEQENKNVLRLEALVLKRVQSCAQVVRYLGSGCTGGMHFLVMEKLGPNLADLRRRSSHGTFNIYTTLKAGISCLQAIREVHERGLIHRDIKPSNFITGMPGTPEHSVCYLIDFGLARRYRRASGELREAREHAGFRGTSRYASVASHRHTELGRVDDLWSLLFMLIEFATGTLPWRKYKVKEDIGRCKERSINPRLVRNLPREFQLFLSHLQSLRYEDEPDYELLLSCLHRAVERRGYPADKLLDWQIEPGEESGVEDDAPPLPPPPPAGASDPNNDAGAADLEPVRSNPPSARHAAGGGGRSPGHDSLDGPLVSPSPIQEPALAPVAEQGSNAIRVSEVDVSCPQSGRPGEDSLNHVGAGAPHGDHEQEDKAAASAGVELQNPGASTAAADDAFSPREMNGAPTPSRSHRRRHGTREDPAGEVSGTTGGAIVDETGVLQNSSGGLNPAGTTNIQVPPPPPNAQKPEKPEKEKGKCNCLVM